MSDEFAAKRPLAAPLLLPLLLSLSCNDYPWDAGTSGLVTASSSWSTDGTLTVTGTLDILLSAGSSDTSFALDGLRFYFEGAPELALEIESLELDEEEWPVFVSATRQEVRSVRFTLRAPPPALPPQTCPTSLSFGVDIEVLADGNVSPYPPSFVSLHVCEGCSTDAATIDIPVAWEVPVENPFFLVEDIEVDATQSVWVLGSGSNTGLLAQPVTPAGAGGAIAIGTIGEAEMAAGTLPGILLVSTKDTGFGGSSGPAPGTPSVRISRYDAQGLAIWERELTGQFSRPTLTAFSGHVLLGITSPVGLFTTDEVLDAAPNDYLVLIDEQTGEVVRFSAGFGAIAMAPTGDGRGVVFGHPSDAIDSPELRLLDTELTPIWSTPLGANGITLFAELAAAGESFFVYDPAAGLVMKRSVDGALEWDANVALGATSLAALPDGGALLGGTGIAMRLDAQGVVTDLTRDEGAPSWCVGPFPDYGFASGGESPGFVFTDPSFGSLHVGRLAP